MPTVYPIGTKCIGYGVYTEIIEIVSINEQDPDYTNYLTSNLNGYMWHKELTPVEQLSTQNDNHKEIVTMSQNNKTYESTILKTDERLALKQSLSSLKTIKDRVKAEKSTLENLPFAQGDDTYIDKEGVYLFAISDINDAIYEIDNLIETYTIPPQEIAPIDLCNPLSKSYLESLDVDDLSNLMSALRELADHHQLSEKIKKICFALGDHARSGAYRTFEIGDVVLCSGLSLEPWLTVKVGDKTVYLKDGETHHITPGTWVACIDEQYEQAMIKLDAKRKEQQEQERGSMIDELVNGIEY